MGIEYGVSHPAVCLLWVLRLYVLIVLIVLIVRVARSSLTLYERLSVNAPGFLADLARDANAPFDRVQPSMLDQYAYQLKRCLRSRTARMGHVL